MFELYYNNGGLSGFPVDTLNFKPFPDITQREKWNELPSKLKMAIVSEGESFLGFEWPALLAVRFMDFGRNGNRDRYEKIFFKRRYVLGVLVIAECIEDKGRFTDDIINGIWSTCEETAWWFPAHRVLSPGQANDILPDAMDPILDLFALETAALLAWTHYLLKDRLDTVSKRICERIVREIKARIIEPYLTRNDFFWMGNAGNRLGNWTTWCTSNCLSVILNMEDDPERRNKALYKALQSLDRFVEGYPEDGGCEEGTSYWLHAGGALFDCLEMLFFATGGRFDFYNQSKIREIGKFIYKLHISGDYYINFGDGSARVLIPSALVYNYGKRIGDLGLMALGLASFRLPCDKDAIKYGMNLYRKLTEIFTYGEMENYLQPFPFPRDIYIESLQLMAAREHEGSDRGFYLGVKGGHNGQFHNHNDVGTFYVYFNGQPVFVDPGVGNYTARHSSLHTDRYRIWTQRSSYHNLPTINGMEQLPNENHKAKDVQYFQEEIKAGMSMDISEAYPREAGIEYWRRTCCLNRTNRPFVEIIEDFKLKEPAKSIQLTLITPLKPQMNMPGAIVLELPDQSRVQLLYDSGSFLAKEEYIPVDDEKLAFSWGDHLYRIVLNSRKMCLQGRTSIKIMQFLKTDREISGHAFNER